jgi:hypothetical protein
MFKYGDIIQSRGGSFTYQVIGAVCRLYDREELPYPCCRLQWKGKEPYWNRVGQRFVPDIATKKVPSYRVKLVGGLSEFDYSEYGRPLDTVTRSWWYTLTRKDENVCKSLLLNEIA